MKKLIPFTILAAMLCSAGVASADHRGGGGWHGGGQRGGGNGGWRGGDRGGWHGPVVVHQGRGVRVHADFHARPRFEHRNVFIQGGAFHFDGGVVRHWRAPVIRQRYFDLRVQPAPVVEYYDQMPGYTWCQGQWQWSGQEWQWIPGHYEVAADYNGYDQGYDDQGYDDQGYDYQQGYDGYQQGYVQGAPAYPTVPPPNPY